MSKSGRAPSPSAFAPETQPVRVLVTLPAQGRPGGVSQYFHLLKDHFRSEIRYFPVGSRSDGEGLRVSLPRMLLDSLRFAKALRSEPVDLVHLNPSLGSKALVRDGILLLLAKLSGSTTVVFVHGIDRRGGSELFLRRFFGLVYNQADAFIVLSTEIKDKLIAWRCKPQIFVHTAPVDEVLTRPLPPSRSRDNELESPRPFHILFLARIERSKGIYEAVDAYRLLRREFPFLSLTVAGDGSELPAIRNLVADQKLPGVSFAGFVTGAQKLSLLHSANAYLFPSHFEGLPLSVLEAMACGLPVVASAVGGLRDFFVDGQMGFLSDDQNPETLCRLLRRLILNADLCSTIGRFNRAYASEHFGARRVALGIDAVYRRVLEWPG